MSNGVFDGLAAASIYAAAAYAAIGFIFGACFVAKGVGAVDASAKYSGLGFRLLILPGSALFWPLLAMRWLRADGEPPSEREPHR
jgi:hypothetical protein